MSPDKFCAVVIDALEAHDCTNAAALLRTQFETWRDKGTDDSFCDLTFALRLGCVALQDPALFDRCFALCLAGHAAQAHEVLEASARFGAPVSAVH